MIALLSKQHGYWSVPQLVGLVIAQFLGLLLLFQVFFSEYAAKQWASGFWSMWWCFIGLNFIGAFLEWGVHRYALHLVVFPLAAAAATSHRRHHGLTPVRVIDSVLVSDYPISRPEQLRSARFPPSVFWVWFGLFTPFIYAPLQMVFPAWPIIVAGWCSMTWMHCLYEVWHGLEHASYDRYWRHWVKLPLVGRWVTKVYAFHLIHHANPNCNQAIGGFFGLPIADWLFGTYLPLSILPNQPIGRARLVAPTPRFCWIRRLDQWAQALDRRYSLTDRGGFAP